MKCAPAARLPLQQIAATLFSLDEMEITRSAAKGKQGSDARSLDAVFAELGDNKQGFLALLRPPNGVASEARGQIRRRRERAGSEHQGGDERAGPVGGQAKALAQAVTQRVQP